MAIPNTVLPSNDRACDSKCDDNLTSVYFFLVVFGSANGYNAYQESHGTNTWEIFYVRQNWKIDGYFAVQQSQRTCGGAGT